MSKDPDASAAALSPEKRKARARIAELLARPRAGPPPAQQGPSGAARVAAALANRMQESRPASSEPGFRPADVR
jgi:hypothetical protein